MTPELEKLEIVYYSSPIPHNPQVLTFLGLIFDRVHFPDVHIPAAGFDPDWIRAEIERLEGLPTPPSGPRYETWLLIEMMKYVLNPDLREFCYFTGDEDQFLGKGLEAAKDLVYALYEQIYGRRENFEPIFDTSCHKGLGGDKSIAYPGAFYYPANALLYSGRTGIPLLNSNPALPVPAYDVADVRHNVKLLTAIMAIQCVQLVLPEIGALQPSRILEARADLAPQVQPFRLALLRLARQLSGEIQAGSTRADILQAAEFLAKTEVYPSLAEFKAQLERPRKGWKERSWELLKKVPELAPHYATFNLAQAVPKTLLALGDWLVDGFSQEKPRSDYYYLLKLRERADK